MTLVPRVVALLREQGIDDVVVTVGGTIRGGHTGAEQLGVAESSRGRPTQAIVDFIRSAIDARDRTRPPSIG